MSNREVSMIRALDPSLSGIRASFKLLDAASGNIANSNTNGYKSKTVSFQENGNGVSTAISTDNSQGPAYQLDGRVFEGSNVNMASELVSLITARHMLSLNAAAFRTAADMEKSLVDTLA